MSNVGFLDVCADLNQITQKKSSHSRYTHGFVCVKKTRFIVLSVGASHAASSAVALSAAASFAVASRVAPPGVAAPSSAVPSSSLGSSVYRRLRRGRCAPQRPRCHRKPASPARWLGSSHHCGRWAHGCYRHCSCRCT